MPIYKVLDDVLSVKKELKPYAMAGDFCELISKHGHVWILQKVKLEMKNGLKTYSNTGVTFSTFESNLKLIQA